MRRVLAAASCAAILSTVASCQDCYDDYVTPGYRITVVDSVTETAICDAEVSVSDMEANRSSEGCSYWGAIPTGSRATITVAHPGYRTESVEVSTQHDEDECGHAVAKPVTIELVPE
jgi:hypothetical protein